MALKVSEVAKIAGVTVRTLHHYDEIGLVRPSERTSAGYRLYGDRDLERLQQVLFFRELDFPLEEIERILNDPAFDVGSALGTQRRLLSQRAVRINALIAAVDKAIDAIEKGTTMTNEERFEVFGDFDPQTYEAEVEQRWGDTDAYKESAQRTKRYTKADWVKIKAEGGDLFLALARLDEAGVAASSVEAMDLAERHRQHIERWFYTCPHALHRAVGDGYVTDVRFTQNIDRVRIGLAVYARDAFRANATRHGS